MNIEQWLCDTEFLIAFFFKLKNYNSEEQNKLKEPEVHIMNDLLEIG
jgi:Ulp1 family protease